VRDETCSKALAEPVNYQRGLPFAADWRRRQHLVVDGQFYPVGGIAEHVRQVNLRYGTRPGVTL
jgi:TnpA family transposase